RAMSEENVEIVRRGIEAWSRGDLDAVAAVLDPDFEFQTSGVFPGLRPLYRGHDGFRTFTDDFRAPWQSLRVEIARVVDAGDRIVALFTFEAVGRDGVTVQRRAANLFTLREGLAIQIRAYGDWDEALEAVGLRA